MAHRSQQVKVELPKDEEPLPAVKLDETANMSESQWPYTDGATMMSNANHPKLPDFSDWWITTTTIQQESL